MTAGSKWVMVVDDDDDFRELVVEMLDQSAYTYRQRRGTMLVSRSFVIAAPFAWNRVAADVEKVPGVAVTVPTQLATGCLAARRYRR